VIPAKAEYLARPGDSQALADAVTRILEDPRLRAEMGAAGRHVIDPAFRAETMVAEIAEVYEMLIRGHAERVAQFDPAVVAAGTA
jgi:glycosyltransferase involved in cell wall biosynthesis